MNNQFTWLHIGLGSFHRAHQAWYLHRLIASGDNRWRIAAGNIRNDAEQVVQALAAQGGRYVLETVSPEGEREYEEITSIQKLLPWQAGLQPLINEGANPQTKVIAFTVTEGGYYLNTRHRLETSNPDLQADLQGECKTIYGTLARILEKRMADNAGPLTLLNCDNVRHNGERFHDGMVEFLQLTGKQAVIDWMAANTTCPNTMVDRITPRPAADLPARIKAQTGIDDKAPVMGETFIQWVVENNFRDARPDGFSKIPAMIAPTLQECYQRGVRPEATAMLPALFFVFMEQWHKGTLPYQYQDGILDAQAVHEMFEAQDPVAVFARDKALFGDLANNADFLALMREKVAAVYTLIN